MFNNEIYKCEYCETEILWDGADDVRGTIWSCEQENCGKVFCSECFVKKHGRDAWSDHVNHESCVETGIMCPDCYNKAYVKV